MKKKIIKLFFKIFLLCVLTGPLKASDNVKNTLSLGPDSAKVTVKVFSSLTCPHCATFHLEIFDKLKKDFIDKKLVKFEHHSFPLDLAALNAEIIVKCSLKKEDSFKLLKKMYENQNKWAVGKDIKKINSNIMNVAEQSNLKKAQMQKCLVNEKIQDNILNERILAQKNYNITSTPLFLLMKKNIMVSIFIKTSKKQLRKIYNEI